MTAAIDRLDTEAGRLLFARECRFVAGATHEEILPPPTLPEVAFAGRSNVGKSSLVNALTGRSTLARVSNTPGRTQQINFFDLGGRLMLVDLPGFGFAKVSKTKVRGWTGLIFRYLRGRPTLRRVCLLVDAPYQILLTKADKLKPVELEERQADVAREIAGHVAAHPDIIATSAQTGAGIPAVRAHLAALAEPAAIQ
jgi:GTP-binding protein